MRFGWFLVGAVAGMFGGAVANEWRHMRCQCAPRGALTGGAPQLSLGAANGLEQAAREAMQYAQQWGVDALSSAQIAAIDAWELAQKELGQVQINGGHAQDAVDSLVSAMEQALGNVA